MQIKYETPKSKTVTNNGTVFNEAVYGTYWMMDARCCVASCEG